MKVKTSYSIEEANKKKLERVAKAERRSVSQLLDFALNFFTTDQLRELARGNAPTKRTTLVRKQP